MDANRFDVVSKLFAARRLSRREVMGKGGAGLAAGALAAGLSRAAAQEATPSADADAATADPSMLFVQSFQSGSIAPVEGADGRYTVTLEQGLGQTIYFSDRPERIVGTDPTAQFLEGFPFLPDNPPNAALIVETAPGETDFAVVELFAPLYDPVSKGVIYEVAVLENWEDSTELGFAEASTDLATLAPTFGAAHLFIDDCPSMNIDCIVPSNINSSGTYTVGTFSDATSTAMCWNYGLCIPCVPYGHTQPDRCSTLHYWWGQCNSAFSECGGNCHISWAWPGEGWLCWE